MEETEAEEAITGGSRLLWGLLGGQAILETPWKEKPPSGPT